LFCGTEKSHKRASVRVADDLATYCFVETEAVNQSVDMMVSVVKWPAFQAKGDATGPPRKSESKVSSSSVKRTEEKKRHERRLSTSVAAKQEASDKEEKREREVDVGEGLNPFLLLSFFIVLSFFHTFFSSL
jgi:hypothetical protein